MLPEQMGEPPFPGCPCWCCVGNFDFFYYMGLCGDVMLPAVTKLLFADFTVLFRTRGSWRDWAIETIERYQTEVSAKTPARCHFTPSCSNYGLQALRQHGFVRGMWLIVKRLYRCRMDIPWGTSDPVTARHPQSA